MDSEFDDVLIEDDAVADEDEDTEDEDTEEDFLDDDVFDFSDLDSGFDETISPSERDVDEDVEDDDTEEIDDLSPMTENEEPAPRRAHSGADEVELPLDVMLETGAEFAPDDE
jgi:hypothetical protein